MYRLAMRFATVFALAALAMASAHAQVLRLPLAACAEVGAQGDGFEDAALSWRSHGVGGTTGFGGAFVAVPGFETNPGYAHREYFYFVPEVPIGQAMPLVIALHGAAGTPSRARTEARIVRDLWTDAATRYGFAVISPVAGGSQGSWVAPFATAGTPSDYDVIAEMMHHLEARHDIERARRYLWGFSAGGHVTLDLLLNERHAEFNRRQFAAVAVNAGVLAGLACAGDRAAGCDQALRDAFPRLPLNVLVGELDPLVAHAANDAPRFLAGGWIAARNYRLQTFGGGHYLELSHPEQHWQWLCQYVRRQDPIERFRLRPYTPE